MWALEEKKLKALPGEKSRELLWYQQVEEDTVRAQIDAGYGTRYDDSARRLSNLFAVGSDSPNVARHLVRLEKARWAKGPSEGGLNYDGVVGADGGAGAGYGRAAAVDMPVSMASSIGGDSVQSMQGASMYSAHQSLGDGSTTTQLARRRKKAKTNKRAKNSLTLTSNDSVNGLHAVTLAQRMPGGKFYSPALPDPYEAQFSGGIANRVRDAHGGAPNISAHLCSKSDTLFKPPGLGEGSGHTGDPNMALLGEESRYRHTFEHLRGVQDLYKDMGSSKASCSSMMGSGSSRFGSTSAHDHSHILSTGGGGDFSLSSSQSPRSRSPYRLSTTTSPRSGDRARSSSPGTPTGSVMTNGDASYVSVLSHSAAGSVGWSPTSRGGGGVSASGRFSHASFNNPELAIDQSLAGCGRLRLAEDIKNVNDAKPIERGLNKQEEFIKGHAEWLKRVGTEGKLPAEERNIFLTMHEEAEAERERPEGQGEGYQGSVHDPTSQVGSRKGSIAGGGADGSGGPNMAAAAAAAALTDDDVTVGGRTAATQSTWSTFDWSAAVRGSEQPNKEDGSLSARSALSGSVLTGDDASSSLRGGGGRGGSTRSKYDAIPAKDKKGFVPTVQSLVGPDGANPNRSPHKGSTYQTDQMAFLNLTGIADVKNPWRPTSPRLANTKGLQQSLDGSAARAGEGGGKTGKFDTDPHDYDRGVVVSNAGDFALTVKSQPNYQRPSKELVRQANTKLMRRNLLEFDTRIVETATIVKAVQDNRLPAPGMAAIMDMHFRLMDAAALNPNPWVVHRHQFMRVMEDFLPWVPKEGFGRLFSAYDPDHTGVIRFVRLSATLVAGSRPQMADLIGLLAEDTRGYKYAGEIVIVKLIHFFYEQCEGGLKHEVLYHNKEDEYRKAPASQSEMLSDGDGVGMRLTDLSEALGCCAASVEDQIRMNEEMEQVVQLLFEAGQRKDIIAGPMYQEQYKQQRKVERAEKQALRASRSKGGIAGAGAGSQFGGSGGDDFSITDSLVTGADETSQSSMYSTAASELSFDISLASVRSGLPGDKDFLESLKLEKQRTNTEVNWRKQSQRRRDWQSRIGAKMRGEEVEVGAGEASLLEGSGVLGAGGSASFGGLGASTSGTAPPTGLFAGGHESMWSEASGRQGMKSKSSSLARAGASAVGGGSGAGDRTLGGLSSLGSHSQLPQASAVLKHQSLRAVKHIPRVSKRDLVEAMRKAAGPVEEFHRQVIRLRDLMIPYTLKGSVTYEETKNDFARGEGSGVYGARHTSQVKYEHDMELNTSLY